MRANNGGGVGGMTSQKKCFSRWDVKGEQDWPGEEWRKVATEKRAGVKMTQRQKYRSGCLTHRSSESIQPDPLSSFLCGYYSFQFL